MGRTWYILTGGEVISEEVGLKLENADISLLGTARKVVTTKDETTIVEGGVVAEKVAGLEPGHGLNAATGEYVDLIGEGIIDPAKVTRSALQNAASIAALFLTTEAVVADKPEPAPAGGGAPDMGDMGGMGF